jgi:hypothetical protein
MITQCPHCKEQVIISKLNCCIFIHAVMKKTGKQVNPHTSKAKMETLIKDRLIYGCGRGFRIIKNNDTYEAINM